MSSGSTRREFISGGAGGLAFWSGSEFGLRTQREVFSEGSGETLLATGFESISSGGYPDGWTPVGNTQQEVVDSDSAAKGDHCLRLKGEPRGCWEALADAPVRIPNDTPVRIAAWIGPVDDGSEGCHDHHAGFTLRTATGRWNAGNGVQLLSFQTDGRIVASDGTPIGRYEWNEWTRVEVLYERNGDSVTQSYRIDGEQRESITRSAADHEDELSYLRLSSGEYLVYYDDVLVETDPIDSAGGAAAQTSTSVTEPAATGESGGVPIVDLIVDLVEFVVGLIVLGFSLLMGVGFLVGVYEEFTSGSDSSKSDEAQTTPGENDGVQYNEHGELIRED